MSQRAILQTLSFTVVFIMALATIHTLFSITSEFTRNRSWIDIIIRTVGSQGMILVVMPSFLLATKLVSLRVFRLLPLTSNEISNRFFKLVTYTIIAQNAVLFGIIATVSGTTEGLKILSHFLVVSSVGTLIIPVIVRFGLKPITFGILFPLIGVMSYGRIFFQNSVPLVAAPMIAIVIILISRYLTECIIRRSSNAYRLSGAVSIGAFSGVLKRGV